MLTKLNLSGLNALTRIDCSKNQINQLSFSDCKKMSVLVCTDNQISELANLPERLSTLDCSRNQLQQLNVSYLRRLSNMTCTSNRLHSLNIKNGIQMRIEFDKNPQLSYICALETQQKELAQLAKNYGYTSVVINSDCHN
jgi:Leucine-rich repeat (LRR) protein